MSKQFNPDFDDIDVEMKGTNPMNQEKKSSRKSKSPRAEANQMPIKAVASPRSPRNRPVDREAFGQLIYQMDEALTCADCIGKEQLVIRFYEKVIIVSDDTYLFCYPPGHKQQVFPKYRVNGISIYRPQLSKNVFFFNVVLIIVGIVLCSLSEDAEEESKDLYTYSGVPLIIIPFLYLLTPFMTNKYTVRLNFHHTESKNFIKQLGGCCSSLLAKCNIQFEDDTGTPNFMDIRCSSKPDVDLLMEYVYGSLGDNMNEIHQLVHLMQDDLSDKMKPTAVSDLSSGYDRV